MKNKNILYFIIISILVVIIAFLIIRNSSLKYDLNISDHNYETAKSELVKLKLKNEEIIYQKDALILSEKNMSEELKLTKNELRELNRVLGAKIDYIAKLESSIKVDSIFTTKDSIIYIDNTPVKVKFNMNDKWIHFNGETDLIRNKTIISNIDIPLNLKLGIGDDYSVFVITENPYLTVRDIDAVAVNDFVKKQKRKKHWGFGIYGGFGMHYDVMNKNIGVGPQLGVGFIYRF